ncbi:DNA helicase [Sarracenia purpurea var. burkii]
MTFTNDVPEVSIVKETLGVDGSLILASPGSFSKDENSSSTVIQVPTEFPDQSVLHSTSLSNSNAGPFEYTCSFLATPQKNVTADANSLLAETEGVLNLSVNSHTHKRRKSLGSTLVNPIQVEQFDDRDPKTPGHGSFMASSRTIKDGCSQNKFEMPGVPQLLAGNNGWALCNSSSQVMDKRLQIFCSLCRNPLGLPENHLYVRCSITFSSKTHLATLMKERFEAPEENKSTGIPVVISDISSVDKRLCNRTHEDAQGQGIWSREDGCVFNTIFCPFCSNRDNCLGVQVMATDASNVQLLNKILFCLDCLEIKTLEASKDSSPVCGQNCADPFPIEKFAYIPLQQMSNGWRTTRSKMQLTKRALLAPQGLKDES